MAENTKEIPFKILVETLAAEKSVGELKQEFNDLNAVIEKTKVGTDEYKQATTRLAAVKEVLSGVASDVTQVANANKVLTSGLPALNKEYKDLQRSIQGGKLSADELQKALFRAGEVRGQIRDLNTQINALDPERRFAAFAKIGSTIASGFAAAQAATALFGDENEDLLKILVKVQAATALAQGLQGLAGFQKALVAAGLAMKAFALSNPFTAIAAAIVAVTVAAIAMTKAFGEGAKELERLKKEAEQLEEIGKATERFYNNRIKLLEAQGATIERIGAVTNQFFREQLEDIDNAIRVQQQLRDKGDEEAIKKLSELEDRRTDILTQQNVTVLQLEEKFQKDRQEQRLALLEAEKLLLENAGRDTTKKLIEIEQAKRDAILNDDKKSKEQKQLAEAQYQAAVKKIEESSAKESAERKRKYHEEELTQLEAHKLQLQVLNQSTASVEIEIENKKLEFLKTSGTATKAQIELAQATHAARMKEIYQKQIDDAIKAADEIVNAEAKKWEDLKQFHELNQRVTIETVIQEAEESEDPIAIENAQYQERLLNLETFNAQVDALDVDAEAKKELKRKEAERLEKEHKKRLLEGEKILAAQKLDVTKSGLAAIGELATSFAGKSRAGQKRAFDINKVANIAETTMDTIVAAGKAERTYPPPWGIIAAVATGLRGLARINQIRKTEFESASLESGAGSGAGGGGSFGGADFTPQPIAPPQLNSTPTNTDEDGNFTGFGNQRQPQPIVIENRIVESDLSSVQNNIRRIETNAQFG